MRISSLRNILMSVIFVALALYIGLGIRAIVISEGVFHPFPDTTQMERCVLPPEGMILDGAICNSRIDSAPTYYAFLPWMQPTQYPDWLTGGYYVPADLLLALIFMALLGFIFLRPKFKKLSKMVNRGSRTRALWAAHKPLVLSIIISALFLALMMAGHIYDDRIIKNPCNVQPFYGYTGQAVEAANCSAPNRNQPIFPLELDSAIIGLAVVIVLGGLMIEIHKARRI